MYHNNGSPTDVCPITPSPIRLLKLNDNIRFISLWGWKLSNEPFGCVLHSFVTMTIKRESSTPFGSSSDEEIQVIYDSYTPSEGEVQEVLLGASPHGRVASGT